MYFLCYVIVVYVVPQPQQCMLCTVLCYRCTLFLNLSICTFTRSPVLPSQGSNKGEATV